MCLMAKIRVYELAKELGVESKAILDFLQQSGQPVANHMSVLSAGAVEAIKRRFGRAQGPTRPSAARERGGGQARSQNVARRSGDQEGTAGRRQAGPVR